MVCRGIALLIRFLHFFSTSFILIYLEKYLHPLSPPSYCVTFEKMCLNFSLCQDVEKTEVEGF